jgi:hypothetical protein
LGPITETRSRDEWLAEVKRRGGRLRRRRRVGFGAVAALALVLPASVMAGVLSGGAERAVELSVAGPSPAGGMAPLPAPPNELATGEVPAVATTVVEAPTTTVAEVHERLAAINGVPAPRSSPTSVPPADDPVVGPTTTLVPPVATSGPVQGPAQSAALNSSSTVASPPPCAPEALQIDVVPSKATFALGETVEGTGFVQTRRATGCLLPVPASFRIEDVATGKVVGSSGSVTEHRSPLMAEPGKMYTSTFSWDQQDCSGSICTQVPPGLYQAVAEWTGGGPYRGWGEFRVGG